MSDGLIQYRAEFVGANAFVRESNKINSQVSGMGKTLNSTDDSVKGLSGGVSSLGGVLKGALGVGAFVAITNKIIEFGKQSEAAFAVQEQAETQLAATLKATGEAAGVTFDELTKLASGLQNVTVFGDEAIIKAESLLLTFKNIGEDVFPTALESILNVSQDMGQSLQSSAVQLGKALNDPTTGLTALTRVGITFTDEQKNLIKAFQESGDLASAQGVILKELESQFGGVARAVGSTTSAVKTQLSNAYGDLQETIGGVITNALEPYRRSLLDEIVAINTNIQTHLLRNRVLAGNATLVETLSLRQAEQKKASDAVNQAQTNLSNVQAKLNEVLERGTETYGGQIAQLKSGVATAQRTLQSKKQELEASNRAVTATQRAVQEKANEEAANIKLATSNQTNTESTDKNTESKEENTKATEEQVLSYLKLSSQVVSTADQIEAVINQTTSSTESRLIASLKNSGQFTQESLNELVRNGEISMEQYRSLSEAVQKEQEVVQQSLTATFSNFVNGLGSNIGSLVSAINASTTQAIDVQRKATQHAFDEETEKRKASLAEQLKSLKGNEEAQDALKAQYAAEDTARKEAQAAEDLKLRQEAAKVERDGEIFSRALQTGQIIANTAVAVARQYSDLPLIAAIPASIVAGAAGIAQIAAINAAPLPEIPQFQDGGFVPGNSLTGDRVPAMVNSEELILNQRERAVINDAFPNLNINKTGSAQPVTINIELAGRNVGQVLIPDLQRAIDNGQMTINERSVVRR